MCFSFPSCRHLLISLLSAVAICDQGCFHQYSDEHRKSHTLNKHTAIRNAAGQLIRLLSLYMKNTTA